MSMAQPAAPQAGEQRPSVERNASAPATQTPDENKESLGLTPEDEKNLLEIRRRYKQSWSQARRRNIRRALKALEFVKGNQTVSFDPSNSSWFNPVEEAFAQAAGDKKLDLYDYCDNYFQFLFFGYVAAQSADIPKTRFRPQNANKQADVATANAASDVHAITERQNNARALHIQAHSHLFLGGAYFVHTRYVRDGEEFGTYQEPVYEQQEREILPDRYGCPDCGADTPAPGMSAFTSPACQECGRGLGDEHFFPSETSQVPVITGYNDVPNGQTRQTVYGLLSVDAKPDCEDVHLSPIVDLEEEVDLAALRSAYPKMRDELKDGGSSGGGDNDLAKIARQRVVNSALGGGAVSASSLTPTLSRCWITPIAFELLDDATAAKRLKAAFPKGCVLVSAFGGTKFLEAQPSVLRDEWTWAGTVRKLFGLTPPAVGDPAISIQERINDGGNVIQEYMDKLAGGWTLADADMINTKGLEGQSLSGRIIPVKRKSARSQMSIKDALYQPQFHVDSQIFAHQARLAMTAQLLTGVMPQIYGGNQDNVETYGGQKQALNTALAKLAIFWNATREENARRAELAVKCTAKHATQDLYDVVVSSSSRGFQNKYVHLDQLQGEANAYPETDQGFPQTYGEIRDRLEKILADSASNPMVAAWFEVPQNAKVFSMIMAPPGTILPGEIMRDKVAQVLDRIVEEGKSGVGPQEVSGQMVPSVLPDPDVDDLDIVVDGTREWLRKNWQLMDEEPGAYENVLAYLRTAVAYKTAQAAQAAMGALPQPTDEEASTKGVVTEPIPLSPGGGMPPPAPGTAGAAGRP